MARRSQAAPRKPAETKNKAKKQTKKYDCKRKKLRSPNPALPGSVSRKTCTCLSDGPHDLCASTYKLPFWDSGYIIGVKYRDNGKEHGNCYIIVGTYWGEYGGNIPFWDAGGLGARGFGLRGISVCNKAPQGTNSELHFNIERYYSGECCFLGEFLHMRNPPAG